MLDIRLAERPEPGAVLALPVVAPPDGAPALAADGGLHGADLAEVTALLADAEHPAKAGTTQVLARPTRSPRRVVLVGAGTGDEAGWRAAGAAVARQAARDDEVCLALPTGAGADAVRGAAEGLWFASYAPPSGAWGPASQARLSRATLVTAAAEGGVALGRARAVATAVHLARELTGTPSNIKTPAWFAERIVAAAGGVPGLRAEVWDTDRLAAEEFGGVLAVGRGSAQPPRLVRLDWDPAAGQGPAGDPAATRIVLVGKGITFDTGGISLKPRDSMKLMRKDMGGAAAVVSAVLGAAELRLPVRVTALAPLAENAVGADAFRPGDVVRHRGGITSEITNTDAEGRLVLADALAYATAELRPDVIVDLATLTGAQSVALGKRTAALFTEDDELAGALRSAAAEAGESLWRLPLVEEYAPELRSEVADLVNATDVGGGAIMAALYLREFTGAARARWAHVDMSAPAWADSATGDLVKGATGWGVRTLLRWLESLPA